MQEVQKYYTGNGEEITLRQAVPEDAKEIIAAVRTTSLERSYILMEQYGKDTESEKEYISKIDRQKNLLLIAISKNRVVGSLAALQADSGYRTQTSHILNMGLHIIENYRALGIGSQMLKYSIEWAQEHGFKKMTADIFTTNKRSLHLFSKAGFTEECIRRKQIRIGHEYIDEICMSLFLE
jgi:RimJ/RimL family protein N-acetyltransferase